jgi:hypothetical protein
MTKRDDKQIEDVEMLEYWINLLSFRIHSSLGVLHYKIDRQELENTTESRREDRTLTEL